ncbi:MAG: DUF1800 domain-containing protein [Opitutae bacterium]|nr:DUF1800 domain-containing protein [Opitutae bacterium]
MADSLHSFAPSDAWQPLPAAQWDEPAARHLLRRLGFTAAPAETARALHDGPAATLARTFARMPAFPPPPLIAALEADSPRLARKLTSRDPAEKRLAGKDARERSREALADLTLRWLAHAARPENSGAEKWLLFLQDVWVVGLDKVKNSALLYRHQDLLRQAALGDALTLARAMSRSPAMIVYLDLQQSKAGAPNENFARELFELFTLGEGHYTEQDIKEAARAFTGYRQQLGTFRFAARQHDRGPKTVFGRSGNYDGDDVLQLVFRQPAAATFLPREMARFYLADSPLPAAHLDALGRLWARDGFGLRPLATRFFGSRLFFAPEFRGNFIKSPVQFYLGLLQDLDLGVAPLPRQVIGVLRQMGQMPFNPPNVRGWVGGRAWINSATLAARRQLVQGLLHPLNRDALNADELHALDLAAADGPAHFTLDDARLEPWLQLPNDKLTASLLATCLPGQRGTALEQQIGAFLERSSARKLPAIRAALATLLESPNYQLC